MVECTLVLKHPILTHPTLSYISTFSYCLSSYREITLSKGTSINILILRNHSSTDTRVTYMYNISTRV